MTKTNCLVIEQPSPTLAQLKLTFEIMERKGFDLNELTWFGWDDESLVVCDKSGDEIFQVKPNGR